MNHTLHYSSESEILNSVIERLGIDPDVANVIDIQIVNITSLAKLFGLILGKIAQDNGTITDITEQVFSRQQNVRESSVRDISETARRNFEIGRAHV